MFGHEKGKRKPVSTPQHNSSLFNRLSMVKLSSYTQLIVIRRPQIKAKPAQNKNAIQNRDQNRLSVPRLAKLQLALCKQTSR